MTPSVEVIEHARRVKNVPADWLYTSCAAGCGEVVFYPPGVVEEAESMGVPMMIVCSGQCWESWQRLEGRQ